jgi:glycosyltransferase involved in cell wall biosynthesis
VLFDANLLLRITKFLAPKLTIVQSLVSTPYSAERIKDPRFPQFKFKIIKMMDCISARAVNSYYHAITQTVLTHYRPLFNLKEAYCVVINRGRKLNLFINDKVSLKRKFGFGDSFVFLTVGRQEVQKGQLVILEALKEIRTHHPYTKDIKIVFLGREGGMTPHLRSFVKSNELEQFVTFMGFRNDVEEILASSDVFLFPSYLEGMGGALVEALAAGCPVICSDIPVLKEVIGAEDGAVFVKPGNFVQTALAMVKLYCDDELRSELSRKSLDKFNTSYQIEAIHSRMLDMYTRIVSMQWK